MKKDHATIYCIRQIDSTHVKIENLRLNTSYSVSVSIFNAMQEYRTLPDEKVIRTLPTRSYRPMIIPVESIMLDQFIATDNPNELNVSVLWAPADGMCSVVDSDLD